MKNIREKLSYERSLAAYRAVDNQLRPSLYDDLYEYFRGLDTLYLLDEDLDWQNVLDWAGIETEEELDQMVLDSYREGSSQSLGAISSILPLLLILLCMHASHNPPL